jgi:hypothetical protein
MNCGSGMERIGRQTAGGANIGKLQTPSNNRAVRGVCRAGVVGRLLISPGPLQRGSVKGGPECLILSRRGRQRWGATGRAALDAGWQKGRRQGRRRPSPFTIHASGAEMPPCFAQGRFVIIPRYFKTGLRRPRSARWEIELRYFWVRPKVEIVGKNWRSAERVTGCMDTRN